MSKWLWLCIVLLVLLTVFAASAAPATPAADTTPTMYTVGYAHLDTQWRWDYPVTIGQYIPDTLSKNFALFEKYPDYIFNFSGSNRYRMMQEYYPKDYAKLQQYARQGRWFPCGSSVEECDVNSVAAESIIRQVLIGNNYFRHELGTASEEFMLPDCFGFPASLPSALAHCGLKGFSTQKLTWGSAVGIPFNVGVWEGPDGKSVIAALNPGSYGGEVKEDLSKNADWLKRITTEGQADGLYKDYFYYGTGDMGGSPTEESVQWIEKSAKSNGPVKVLPTKADQLFLDITPAEAAKLPRYKGDLELTEHSAGSITSQAYMKRWNHKNELLADSAERASVAASLLGGPAYPQSKLNRAWTLVMGGQFHDILPGTSTPKAYEFSYNDEALALNQFGQVLEQAAGAVASGLNTRVQGQAVVVYNPLSVARQDVVEATLPAAEEWKAVKVVGPDSQEVPSQLLEQAGGKLKLLFLAQVPATGFAVYDVRKNSRAAKPAGMLSVTGSTLENDRYKVSLDAGGDIASVYDKLAQRELLSAPSRLAFSHDHPGYWPAWNMDWKDAKEAPTGYVEGPVQIRIAESGPVRATLEVTRLAGDSRFVQRISLAAGGAGDRVEVANKIDWRGQKCNLKAVFPLSVSNPKASYNWEIGVIERTNDDEKKYEVPSHQWFDLTDSKGDYGVTVLCPCKYGSDKPNDNTLRLTLLRSPGAPGNDYRDQEWQDWGRHDISYGLAGHAQSWREGQTYWQAMRMDQPLVAFNAAKHSGQLGKQYSLLSLNTSNVRVLAVKKAENSDETVVRLVELNGQPQPGVEASFSVPVLSAREVDGQEREIGAAKVESGKLVCDFGPFAVHTFALKLGAPPSGIKAAACVPLELPCNACVATRDGEAAGNGFDDEQVSLAAEMLPGVIDDGGVTFELAPAGGGSANAVSCAGQELALPKTGGKLYLLCAASPGDQQVEFAIDGKPLELTIQDWGGYIGQWDTRLWEGDIPAEAFEWPYAFKGLAPGYMKPAQVAWFSSHRHDAEGKNLIYSYSYLYRYALDLPTGAKTVKLPDNPKVKILAMTVANDPAAGLTPAQPLYDDLADHTPDVVK